MATRPKLDSTIDGLIQTMYKALTNPNPGNTLPATNVNTTLQTLGGYLYHLAQDVEALQKEVAQLKAGAGGGPKT